MAALTELYPRAYRLSRFLARALVFCLKMVALFSALVVLSALAGHTIFALVGCVAGLAIGLFLALAIAVCSARCVIITVFFTRYSLMHLLGLMFAANCILSLYFLLPDDLKPIPVIFTCWMALAAFIVVGFRDDPDQPPQFIQEALAKARRL